MSAAPFPPDERERLATLAALGVVDGPGRFEFGDLARLAAHIAGVPIALISVIDAERQHVLAHHGLAATEAPRTDAFCAWTILEPEKVLVVGDARADPRFEDNPYVRGEPHVVFYAGAPLVVDDHAIGTLCLIDHTPRTLSPDAEAALRTLARQAETQFELVRSLRAKDEALAALEGARTDALRLARIVDLMHRAVLVYQREPNGGFRLVARNAAAVARAPRPESVAIGSLVSDMQPARNAEALGQALEAALLAPDAGPHIRQGQNVAGRTYEIDFVPLEKGTVALIADDVTERVTLERAKDEFLAIAAHELRTPLSGMIGSLGLLSSGALGDLPDEAREAALIAEIAAMRLSRLTTDMLDLETLRQGRLTLRAEPTEIGTLTSAAVSPLRGGAAARGVTLSTEGDLGAVVDVDRDRMVQVLTNLAANALRYAPPGTAVTMRGTVDDDAATFVVADLGPGIRPGDQARLFGRFVQLEPAERGEHRGTGLGLAIVKALVELHGGTVSVESDPATRPGTRFTVRLPRRRDAR